MHCRNVQIRTIVPVLMVAVSLLSIVHANASESHREDHEQRQCGTASPLSLTLGDAYFDIAMDGDAGVVVSEDMAENEILSRLSTLHLSDGSGVTVLCIGSPGQTRARMQTVSLTDIEGRKTLYPDSETAISITVSEYDKSSRRLARETLTIPTRSQDVTHLAGQSLATSKRHRQATLVGSYLEETRINAFISDDTITIDQSVYVNGSLAQWHTWTLPD